MKQTKLDVVKSHFLGAEQLSWEELFDGFDELYAITFSSGLQFMNKLLQKFSYAEVIFGCEKVMGDGLEAIIALENSILKQITKKKALLFMSDMVKEGRLNLYISRDTKSHEKIYLLKSNDGRTRVITGSANMSGNAFNGYQRENITYYDDKEAFEWYFNRFIGFRDQCSGEVSKDALSKMSAGEVDFLDKHPDEISVMREAKTAVVQIEKDNPDVDTIEIVTNVKGMEAELKQMLPKPKKNVIMLMAKDVLTFSKKAKEYFIIQEEKKKVFPKLHIDYDNEVVDFNGEVLDLHPEKEKVKNDAKVITSYLDSLSDAYGDTKQAQMDYFAFLNWYFASAFMPYLKWQANRTGDEQTRFPVYGILYGPSNGAKSTFIKMLEKAMCGKTISLNVSSDFTTTNISKLKQGCEGLPINIDDLDKEQFSNHMRMIKADEWGTPEHFINYPAVAITSNKIPALEAPISKRVIAFYIDMSIDREFGLKRSKQISNQIKKLGNSLYCEYLNRMFPEINEIVRRMQTEEEYQADIFLASSRVLSRIFEENGCSASYIREVTISDYMGDKIVGRNAIKKLKQAWENEPGQFVIDRRRNKITYSIPKYGNSYDLKYIADELPVTLGAKRTSTCLTMELDKAEDFLGIQFKKKLFGR